MRNRLLSAPSVGRILAVGGSISFLNVISTAPNDSTTTKEGVDEHGVDDDFHEDRRQPQCQKSSPRRDAIEDGSFFQRILNHSRSWADHSTFAPQITSMEAAAHSTKIGTSTPTSKVKTFDYVVIGCGNAGRAALQTLRDECPAASIALVDPMQSPKVSKKVEYYANRAVGLDPRERLVTLDDSGESVSIRYKHAVLMATGARGAPPPHYLMEDKALDRIYELRPTVRSEPEQRPVMSPSRVQNKVLRAAAAGSKVCVLGSGWEAIDLVVAAAAKAPSRAAPALIFGNSGPLGHILPSYLSAAVSKRLKSKKIDVQDRTLIRYISHDDQETKPCLQIYVAKSFDFLDTNRTAANLVVVAPEVSGARGSAVLPTGNIPPYLETTRGQRAWYETWSKLTMPTVNTPSTVVCYKEDGRIAVNTELSACAGVYAAGSVAKYANGLTGHADVAGVGIEDGVASGRVAATNMSGLFHSGSLLGFGGTVQHAVSKDPIPVWRSDLRAYPAKDPKTSLPDVGITALCVGNCDSERFYTQGVWWTNQSAHKRMFDRLTEAEAGLTKRLTKRQKRRKLKESLKPVYGLGFVYYMDRSGKIQGIMSWGVPFTTRGDELNDELVQQMKTILTSNGEASRNSEIDHMRMTNYLSDESRRMVETAFSGFVGDADGQAHQLDGEIENFPRPYHRYTEVRPPNVRTLGLLKRKGGQGHGVLGEDLFARYEEAVEDAPPPRPYTAGNVGHVSDKPDAMYEWSLFLQKEQQWDENESRARPAKEDPLWVRKGDEARNIASRETIAASYVAAIWTPRPVR
jgi:hypothetical protein